MAKPGDIIKKADIIKKGIKGNYYFTSRQLEGKIHFNNIASEDISENREGVKIVENLVCLRDGVFGVRNYESHLCQHFYRKGGKAAPGSIDTWLPRWRSAAENPEIARCRKPGAPSTLPAAARDRKWRFVHADNWIMPALASAYPKTQTEQSALCPCPLDREKPLPPIYNGFFYGEPPKDIPPFAYSATMVGGLLKSKPLTIYVHGALDPVKWHTNIRKHLLSEPKGADRKEAKLWQSWLKRDFPDWDEVKELFSKCGYVQGETSNTGRCERCEVSHFHEVHEKLDALSRIYFDKAVTYWESNTTKLVKIIPQPAGEHDLNQIRIQVFKKHRFQINGKTMTRYPLLILNGWCYEPIHTMKHAAVHLNILTFYLAKHSPDMDDDTVLPNMEIRDVARI